MVKIRYLALQPSKQLKHDSAVTKILLYLHTLKDKSSNGNCWNLMFSDKRSGDIVSKSFISQGGPHKPAFFIIANTDTHGTVSPLQLAAHAEEGFPLQKSRFPLLWKTPGSFLSLCWPCPHSRALPALHSAAFSEAAASPPCLGSVTCSHPGRSFTFLRPWVSLYCIVTYAQKHIFLEGASSAKQQCKVEGKSGVISTSNYTAIVIRSEGIVRVELFLGTASSVSVSW